MRLNTNSFSERSSFDFVFLTSVFTHLLPEDMNNYFSEVVRVLTHARRCLITYFLLTFESLPEYLHRARHEKNRRAA